MNNVLVQNIHVCHVRESQNICHQLITFCPISWHTTTTTMGGGFATIYHLYHLFLVKCMDFLKNKIQPTIDCTCSRGWVFGLNAPLGSKLKEG